MSSMKMLTARAVKWNAIDRLLSQVLYAITGIVLARLLSPEDFGLVGALLIFQAFATLLIDSGFSWALLQRKNPTHEDYSSVLWFNMLIATAIYLILFAAAPLIADIFQHDARLIPLSRVMFLTFILNASAIVQINRFNKQLDARPVAIANAAGLVAGGIVGIWLAVSGFGAWAIVWQAIAIAAVKSAWLWVAARWVPEMRISWTALRSFFAIGSGMMFTGFLNTLFTNIYSFFIGNRVGLVPLGYYSQGDKWSKMGVSSLIGIFNSAFLPVLSEAQDDPVRYRRVCSKMNRAAAYSVFPATIGLAVMATPIFHLLFGTKWDPSIPLFQLLLVRGIFTVFTSLYNGYILSLGHSARLVRLETVRDIVAIVALVATLPFMGLSTPERPVLGLEILLWGQVLAAVVGWAVTLRAATRLTGASTLSFLADCAPYLAMTLAISALIWFVPVLFSLHPIWILLIQAPVALGLYMAINYLAGSRIQADAIAYFRNKL